MAGAQQIVVLCGCLGEEAYLRLHSSLVWLLIYYEHFWLRILQKRLSEMGS